MNRMNDKRNALSLVNMVINNSNDDVQFLDALKSASRTPGRVLKRSARNIIDTAVKDEATLLVILDKVNRYVNAETKQTLTTPEKQCFNKWFDFLLERKKTVDEIKEVNVFYESFVSIFDIK